MPVYGRQKFFWYKETVGLINEDPPAPATDYTAIDTTRLTKIWSIITRRTDDDINAKNVTVTITLDGRTIAGTQNQNNNTIYYWYLAGLYDGLYATTTIYNSLLVSSIRGTSIKVEAQQVDAPGANATFDGAVQHATWRPT